jgi:hypothetical protein
MPAAAMTPLAMLDVTARRYFGRHFLERGQKGVRIDWRHGFRCWGRSRQNNNSANGQDTEYLPYVHFQFLSLRLLSLTTG